MSGALLEMRGLRREFPAGEGVVTVLKDIDLRINAGEMVAIVGASGSGKSTLMNILGCLDRPTAGSYRIGGEEAGELGPDALAALRRERFGFIFQRYHLLEDLSAQSNVELPAVYLGTDIPVRRARARALLARLGLGERTQHRPGQLSGGQQQRVSIARALMNGGAIILADEPTGALDKGSGEEVMRILKELHAEGHTIILVTHDMMVASHAQRVIEISDGVIISDHQHVVVDAARPSSVAASASAASWRMFADRFGEAFAMALRAMNAHRLRTFLTMLGIIIGIAAVVSVVALGRGAQQQVMTQISDLGTNTLDIYPGKDFGDLRADTIETLVAADAEVLAEQPYIDSATPNLAVSVTALHREGAVSAQVTGVGPQHFRVRGLRLAEGRFFDQRDADQHAQVAVIDPKAAAALRAGGGSPLGEVVLLGGMPVEIIGVLKPVQNNSGGSTPTFYVPYTAAATRLVGKYHLDSITLRVSDGISSKIAQQAATALLTERHGGKDFFVMNSDQIRQTITRTSTTLTLLISAIAMIALLVGGIGVMNIMLVSVTERTREIGVRMAIGARQSDILQQFLIEAVLVCLVGGVLGVSLALALGLVAELAGLGFPMSFSVWSIVLAVACSTLIGITFGFLPARNAARLDPVQALARD
ncbi:MacB family efflux pump subunit [Herbaspirillum seropedicae]|uniref:MacB family efflux pump subunit n=1 Tax=Herbaspirillum seropedicae TaxID=964 RepID=UPI00285C393C|nr:MacB family efflux pump subunit [Herbaspirillum seropedicae]MDR6397509.1 macrolide transport system ATP-binding/permease protein [Herbaspirillum seropedicae]